MELSEIKGKLMDVDKKLREMYDKINYSEIKSLIFKTMGNPKKLKRLRDAELNEITKGKGIIGVDGSINNYGGIYPHYIALVQALAKSTFKEDRDILKQDVYVPKFEEDDGQAEDEQKRRAKMSSLELQSASEAMDTMSSDIILMDGSLMHYRIDCPEEWKKFKDKAMEKDKIIIGVTEEVKTKDIGKILKTELNIKEDVLYDREILFGILEEGEIIEFKDEGAKTKKAESGIKSCFVRLSEDPQIVGLDFLEEQYDRAIGYCDLIYTLTPKKGRGIPLWLDIIDKEVKITDDILKGLVESTLSKDIREIFLNPKRNKRG